MIYHNRGLQKSALQTKHTSIKKSIIFYCLIIVTSGCSTLLKNEIPKTRVSTILGSCYAKCLVQDKYEIAYEEIVIFTGNTQNTNAIIDTIDFITAPASSEWVKKKNCLSENPNDSLIWCLRENPAEMETIIIVTDTTTTNEYQILNFEKKKLVWFYKSIVKIYPKLKG